MTTSSFAVQTTCNGVQMGLPLADVPCHVALLPLSSIVLGISPTTKIRADSTSYSDFI